MGINSYRDLKVWQAAMDLVVMVYRASQSFPQQEKFGLTSQLQRSAVSIPSNIAEGHARDSTRDFFIIFPLPLGPWRNLKLNWIWPIDLATWKYKGKWCKAWTNSERCCGDCKNR